MENIKNNANNPIGEPVKKIAVKKTANKNPTWSNIIWVTIIISFLVSSVTGLMFGLLSSNIVSKYIGPATEKYLAELPVLSQDGQPIKTVKMVKEESAIIDTVKKASPSVVSIIVTKDLPKIQRYNPFQGDPFFDQFFGQDYGTPQNDQGTQKQEVGGGTGFVVSANGLILTNKHVADDESAEYTVLTNEGVKIPAKVLALAPNTDLAIIKIDPVKFYEESDKKRALPVAELGDSDNLDIGQNVIAIGNALGEFRNTVSVGVVSGLSRSITASGGIGGGSERLNGIIQTDAAINPGNSGGPLLNIEGQVIGINVAIVSQAQNIGFAIPINDAKKIIVDVEKQGRIIQPFLGVRYIVINEAIAKKNGLAVNHGALILRGETLQDLAITHGSPADKAGLAENDIILEVNGVKVDSNNTLAGIVSKYNVGDTITLKVLRKGKELSIKVKLEERK